MQKLVWQNANGDEINLTSGNYGITEWEGFSNASLNIQNQQVPFQDGAVFLDALIEPRELSVTLKMQDNGNLEERYRMRRELIHILNPKLGEGYLIYTNDYISKRIKCIPQIPLFETHNSDTRGTPKASLAWTACEPYWEDLEETVVILNENEEVEITNQGDVPCAIKATLVPTSSTPIILNKRNEKKIALRGTYSENVYINTEQGKKQITKEGFGFQWVCGDILRDCIDNDENIFYLGDFIVQQNYLSQENSFYYSKNERAITNFEKVIRAFGKYFAIGRGGVYTSEDCVNWELVLKQNDDTLITEFHSIVYSEKLNRCVVTGSDTIFEGTEKSYAWYSNDGINWTRVIVYDNSEVTLQKVGICYSEYLGKFVIIGYDIYSPYPTYIFTSTDGITWTNVTSFNNRYNDVIWVDTIQMLIAVGSNGKIITSTNGTDWIERNTITQMSLNSISYNKAGVIIAGGNNGTIIKSTDGINWSVVTSGTQKQITRIRFIDNINIYIAIGSGIILQSNTGTDWVIVKDGVNTNIEKAININDSNIVIGVGRANPQYQIIKTTNLNEWNIQFTTKKSLTGICYSKNLRKCLAVGNGIICSSSNNGDTWSEVSGVTSEYLKSITYSEDKQIFVIVGDNGTILTSIDGINFASATSGTTKTIQGVEYIKELGCFFACVYSNIVLKSNDGIHWSSINLPKDRLYNKICYNNITNTLLINGSDGEFAISKDGGNTWEVRKLLTVTQVNDLVYDNEKGYYLVADRYVLHYSTDLINWQDVYMGVQARSVFWLKYYNKYFGIGWSGGCASSFDTETNIISDLTSQSDMTFNLGIGSNSLVQRNIKQLKISYRQKYLGV